MNFNSLSYFLFLPAMLALYFLLPARVKNPALLLASYGFYMGWGPAYALLLLLSTASTFFCSLLTARRALGRRRLWLVCALALNFGVLFVFKYFDFFTSLFGASFRLDLLLPVGISFFTFQSVGYAIDVYRGTIPAEKNFIDYALFVSFFPQLVAGPIDRAGNLLPQLKTVRRFSDENLKAGALRMLWGLMKKMILADRLAVIVNTAYADVYAHSAGQLLVAALAFSFQIYCDFSAYSDIACGSAQMLGVRLMENFKFPYGARSLKAFWRRWHISLSTWFQDYLYFPLGGSRVSKRRHCLNLLIVFAVSGLWHGAAVTFVLWGLLHGLAQVIGILLAPARERLYRAIPKESALMRFLSLLCTFAFVTAAWIFFRAETIADALYVLREIARYPARFALPELGALGLGWDMLAVLAFFLVLLCTVDALKGKRDISGWLCRHDAARYAVYFCLIVSLLLFGYYGNAYDAVDFVYFRF